MTGKRATISLTDRAHRQVERAADDLNIDVPDYIRRALAMQRTLDRYIVDGVLIVVDQNDNERHIQVKDPARTTTQGNETPGNGSNESSFGRSYRPSRET